jgi:hypothetical protein
MKISQRETKRAETSIQPPNSHENHRYLIITKKGVLEGFAVRKTSQGESLAKIYLVKQGKAGKK